jgi:purine catabolism regulator
MLLGDILALDSFKGLTVLNSGADLARPVTTVESTETPDIAGFIAPHTLLITTAMSYRDNQQGLRDLIVDLDALPCAGLAIKLGRFIDELEPEVLATADRLGFPLLRIPLQTTLGEVYHNLLAELWGNQNTHLMQAIDIQKRLSSLILQGASLRSIVHALAAAIGRPVAVTDVFGHVLEQAAFSRGQELKRLAALMTGLLSDRESLGRGSFPDQPWDEDGTCSGHGTPGVRTGRTAGEGCEGPEDGTCSGGGTILRVIPIRGMALASHFLVVAGIDPSRDSSLAFLLEQGALSLGMHFLKESYLALNRLKAREEFLPILLNRVPSEHWSSRQILAMGEAHGLKQHLRYQIVLVVMCGMGERRFNAESITRHEEQFLLVESCLREFLQKRLGERLLIFSEMKEWRFALLLCGVDEGLDECYTHVHRLLQELFGIGVRFAQGTVAATVEHVGRSWDTALESLRRSDGSKRDSYLHAYRPMGIGDLLELMPDAAVEDVCTSLLNDLAFPASESLVELRKTLHTYLSCGQSITKTSENLFLHRNSVKYRIKRCEEILGRKLSDPEYCFQVHLALTLSTPRD